MQNAQVVVIDLPEGQRVTYFHDLNIIGLASALDPCEHAAALDELLARWRNSLRPDAGVDVRPLSGV